MIQDVSQLCHSSKMKRNECIYYLISIVNVKKHIIVLNLNKIPHLGSKTLRNTRDKSMPGLCIKNVWHLENSARIAFFSAIGWQALRPMFWKLLRNPLIADISTSAFHPLLVAVITLKVTNGHLNSDITKMVSLCEMTTMETNITHTYNWTYWIHMSLSFLVRPNLC